MKLSELAKVASDEYLFGKNAHLRGSSNCEAHWGDIALSVAKAVLAEAAKRLSEGIDASDSDEVSASIWSANIVRSLATELERESDAR